MIGPRRSGLVGRAAELVALSEAADRARRGNGGLGLIHGEAGVGKSRLCREFAASVGDEALHLRGQAYLGDAVVTHAILVDTLRAARRNPSSKLWDAARRRASTLGAVVPELLAEDDGTVQFDDEARIFESVLDLTEELGAGRLVIWLAEDVQWADPASWRFLHYCSRRAQAMRLLVLTTFRDDESLPDDPAWTRLAVLGTRDGVARMALSRLSEADTERMVRDVFGATLRDDWVRAVAHRSGGTPLLVEELVAMRDAMDAEHGAVPDIVRITAHERARRAGGEARGLLELAAVMGHDADLDLLVDLRPGESTAVDALVDVGLLRTARNAGGGAAVEFRHPLLREAVYEGIPWERRRQLHAEAAAALTRHSAAQSVERVARHWELAGQPAEALASLLDVVASARRQGNLYRITTLGLLALDLVGRHERLADRRADVVEPLIQDLFIAARWPELLWLVREALPGTESGSPRRTRLVALLGHAMVGHAGLAVAEGLSLIEAELAAITDEATPEAALLLDAAAWMAFVRCDMRLARQLAVRSDRAATACGELSTALHARIVLAWVDVATVSGRDNVVADLRAVAAEARQAGLRTREASASLHLARITLEPDDVAHAESVARTSSIWFEMAARALRCALAIFAGNRTAVAFLDELTAWSDEGSQPAWYLALARAWLALMAGMPDEARPFVEQMHATTGSVVSNMSPDADALRGWMAWEVGDLVAAASAFAVTLAALDSIRLEPGLSGPYFLALYIDALVRSGRPQAAASVLAEQASREDRPDADRYTRASFAAARLRLAPSAERLDAALAACEAAQWPWIEGLAAAWGAELLGDSDAAIYARTLWERIGYGPGVARMEEWIQHAQRAAPPASRASRHLTRRERNVVALISEGLTNAQIGERLGISPVTVAHHVSSVLDKLGVASRTQVAVLLARRDQNGEPQG